MIVTFSNQYGTGALVLAQRVAQALGYEYVDRQLPVVVAKRLAIAPEEVEATEDAVPSLGERMLTGLEAGTPELAESSVAENFDRELLRAVQDAVREYAAHGNVVIVGRAAGVLLGPRPDLLRVFVHAPRDWRIERVAAAAQTDRGAVAAEVDRVDRARAAYLQAWYGVVFGDSALYDLSIDASRFGVEAACELIVAALRARAE